jgi:hypothetical protein
MAIEAATASSHGKGDSQYYCSISVCLFHACCLHLSQIYPISVDAPARYCGAFGVIRAPECSVSEKSSIECQYF